MRHDPKLVKMLRDATLEAAQDLANLKLVKPEHDPTIALLKHELRTSVANNQISVAKEARTVSRKAKQSSSHHRLELTNMKKIANGAKENLRQLRTRRRARKPR